MARACFATGCVKETEIVRGRFKFRVLGGSKAFWTKKLSNVCSASMKEVRQSRGACTVDKREGDFYRFPRILITVHDVIFVEAEDLWLFAKDPNPNKAVASGATVPGE